MEACSGLKRQGAGGAVRGWCLLVMVQDEGLSGVGVKDLGCGPVTMERVEVGGTSRGYSQVVGLMLG